MMNQESPRPADIVVTHGLLVTFDSNDTVIKDGAIAIANGEISSVGKTADLLSRFLARETIDATDHVVIPGLINTHTHGPMTLFRGLADGLPLGPWLAHMRDAAGQVIRAETVRLAAEMAYVEMMLGGTTTALDMYFFPEMLVAAAKRVGIRLITGPVFVAHEVSDHIPAGERLARGREFMQTYDDDPLVVPCVMPHSPHGVPLVLLEQAQQLAEEFHARISIHAAETRAEVVNVMAQQGCPPVEFLDRLGMLSPRAILAHCIHLTEDEIALLATRGAVAAHCPISNLKLGDGVAPIPQMLQVGVQVTLGTDGPASSNDLDLWKVLRVAAILHRGIHEEPALTPARQILRMVTADAAKALKMDDRIGSLQVGKRADLVLIDLNRPHLTPCHDVYSLLAYAVGREDISTVLVDGRVVLRDRKLVTCDEAEIMAAVQEIAAQAEANENGYGEQ